MFKKFLVSLHLCGTDSNIVLTITLRQGKVKLYYNVSELADNLMIAQAALFILGAVETSSTTLSFCLHELAYKPDKQVKYFLHISIKLHR